MVQSVCARASLYQHISMQRSTQSNKVSALLKPTPHTNTPIVTSQPKTEAPCLVSHVGRAISTDRRTSERVPGKWKPKTELSTSWKQLHNARAQLQMNEPQRTKMHAFIQRRSTMGMLDSQPVYPDKSACETTAGGVMNYRDQREPQISQFQREAERI